MRAPQCRGLIGRIFGHKFAKMNWTSNGLCFRCGMPEGTVEKNGEAAA